MTLETALRGSGDVGAFLASCWGTKLQDPDRPYESASFLSNLKMRDFESQDFEVTCSSDFRMRIVGDPATRICQTEVPVMAVATKTDRTRRLRKLYAANIGMSVRKLQEYLASLNIERGTTWIAKARARLTGQHSGVVVHSSAE